jgi:hypothetical protein
MVTFQTNDRVIVTRGEHCHKHGKVMDETVHGFWERKYAVQLDNNETLEVPERFLRYENLGRDKVTAEIEDVKAHVKNVASQLPGVMGQEVPTHLGFLREALMCGDKDDASREYDYVALSLKAASKKGAVSEEWMQSINVHLERLNWAVKNLS